MKLALLLPLLLLCSSTVQPMPVQHLHTMGDFTVGYASTSEGFIPLGVVTGWPIENTTGPAQEIESTWTSGGVKHTIRTKLGRGTNATDQAISRHRKLLDRMLLVFPRDP